MAEAKVSIVKGDDGLYEIRHTLTSGMSLEELEALLSGLDALTLKLYRLHQIKAKNRHETGENDF